MNNIYLLTDYQGRFGSKHNDFPYRSGMDKSLLKKYFADNGFETHFINISDIDFRKNDLKNQFVLYTSSEDVGYHYKDYIEDIILGLEMQGAKVIPQYKYLRANNNKVFMEILRDSCDLNIIKSLKSHSFGTAEDFQKKSDAFNHNVVIKTSQGATGTGVYLSKTEKNLFKIIKRIGRTKYLSKEIWDFGRSIKHKGYMRESRYRNKFIVQNFVPNLKNDWKIYIFGEKLFIFYRPILKNRGIKASGGGYDNYFYGKEAKIPEGIFDFAYKIFKSLNIPHASLDIAYNGNEFYLLEFQALYFGTAGIIYSDHYFVKQGNKWIAKENKPDIEKVYVQSIIDYIKKV